MGNTISEDNSDTSPFVSALNGRENSKDTPNWKKALDELSDPIFMDATYENQESDSILKGFTEDDFESLHYLLNQNELGCSHFTMKRIQQYLKDHEVTNYKEHIKDEYIKDELDKKKVDEDEDEYEEEEEEEDVIDEFNRQIKKLLESYPSYLIQSNLLTELLISKTEANALLNNEVEKEMDRFSESEFVDLMCKGEKEALYYNNETVVKMNIATNLDYSSESIIPRLVEKAFYYKGTQSLPSQNRIFSITYYIKPRLMKQYQDISRVYAKRHNFLKKSMRPYVLFHGTTVKNQKNIIKTGFQKKYIGSKTDKGYYGFGHYFSETPSYCTGYASGNQELIGCKVQVGKAYKLQKVTMGCELRKGYDSHVSGCGSEVVIFDDEAILPCFVISFKTNNY